MYEHLQAWGSEAVVSFGSAYCKNSKASQKVAVDFQVLHIRSLKPCSWTYQGCTKCEIFLPEFFCRSFNLKSFEPETPKRHLWPRETAMEVQSLAINALTKRIQEEAKVLPDFLPKLCNQFCLHVVSTSTCNHICFQYTIIYSIHRAIEYM